MNSIFALNTDNKDRINRYDCVENMMVDPNLPDTRTFTTQLFDLLGNHVGFPDQSSSDALEPTPIRESVTSSSVRIIDTSHLDSLKGASCDGMKRQNSFSDAAEASNLFNFFSNDHQANKSIQPYHAENTLARFSAAVDAAIVTFGVRKVNSFPKVRKASSCHQVATSSRVPKRRRISDDIKAPSFRKYQEIQWIEQFRELVKLKEQHGHCLINFKKLHQENKVLSRWIKRQRYQYKLKMTGKVSTMTDARIEMLEDIGFVWNSHATIWDKRFEELKRYAIEHGDCDVPANYPENPALATWVKCQRRQHKLFWNDNKSSSMTLDRMRALDEIGFIWNVREKEASTMPVLEQEIGVIG